MYERMLNAFSRFLADTEFRDTTSRFSAIETEEKNKTFSSQDDNSRFSNLEVD